MRMAVAAEKTLQPQHVGILGAADNDRTAGADLEQTHAAQNQRPHDALAKLGFRDQQCAKPVRRNDNAVYRLKRGRVRKRRPTRHLRQFAQELAGPMGHDFVTVPQTVVSGDFDLAARNDDQAGPDLAGREQLVASLEGVALAEPAHPLDLERLEIGEHLIMAPLDNGLLRRRHAGSD